MTTLVNLVNLNSNTILYRAELDLDMLLKKIFLVTFLTLALIFTGASTLSLFSVQSAYSTEHITLQPTVNGYNSTKLIVLAFDDSPKSQFTLAKPILDKYGFKGSFFTVCTFVNKGTAGNDPSRMTWQDIKTLQQEGHEIESHTMTHTDLNLKSEQGLVYEIAGSKQCLADHGINSTIFAYPASTGGTNATVVNVVSKYYNLAIEVEMHLWHSYIAMVINNKPIANLLTTKEY